MKFKTNKTSFIKDILIPISLINDRAVISVDATDTTCIVSNSENNIILYLKSKITSDTPIELNIGDIKKLLRALDCIEQDEIEINLTSQFISYETDAVTFKYHLLQPGLIQRHTISIEKINKLSFDTEFILNKEGLSRIAKGTSFAIDTNKLYFYTKDRNVYANLADYTVSQSDSIGFKITDGFTGNELKTQLPISVECFKLFQGYKDPTIHVKVNSQLKILVFEITTLLSSAKYIISGLVK